MERNVRRSVLSDKYGDGIKAPLRWAKRMVLISKQPVGFLMAGRQDDRKTSWGKGSES